MGTNRAIVVLGMHRSGTSVTTRGLQACGVFLGSNFLSSQPDNPTGFWEDQEIVRINEALLALKGVSYRDLALFDANSFDDRPTRLLKNEAVAYLNETFSDQPIWGFKDPRTVRLLPFWQSVLAECSVETSYMLALRDPESAAASLGKREQIDREAAHILWMNYMVPFLSRIEGSRVSVLDYDRLLSDPKAQLVRVAKQLGLPLTPEIDSFCKTFVDRSLRHEQPSPVAPAPDIYASELTRDFFSRLESLEYYLPDATFWEDWKKAARPALEYTRAAGNFHQERAYAEQLLRSALRWQKRSVVTRFFHKWNPPTRKGERPATNNVAQQNMPARFHMRVLNT